MERGTPKLSEDKLSILWNDKRYPNIFDVVINIEIKDGKAIVIGYRKWIQPLYRTHGVEATVKLIPKKMTLNTDGTFLIECI